MQMDGREVFRRAVRVMVPRPARPWIEPASDPDDITLVVPHQANIRIIDSAWPSSASGATRRALVLQSTGNTSAASIPLALAEALDEDRRPRRRPRAPRRLRRRHDLGVGGPALVGRRTGHDRRSRHPRGCNVVTTPRLRSHRARHRRQPRHRPGLHAVVPRRRAPGRHGVPLGRRGRRRLRRACDVTDGDAVDEAVAGGRGRARPGRDPGRQRRHHQGRAHGPHVRRRLHLGDRHQPHRHRSASPGPSPRR